MDRSTITRQLVEFKGRLAQLEEAAEEPAEYGDDPDSN